MARRTTLEAALEPDEETEASEPPKPSGRSAKPKEPARPVKLTIELDQDLHRRLKSFALLEAEDASLANIVRAAIHVLDQNQKFAKAVINEAARLKAARKG